MHLFPMKIWPGLTVTCLVDLMEVGLFVQQELLSQLVCLDGLQHLRK